MCASRSIMTEMGSRISLYSRPILRSQGVGVVLSESPFLGVSEPGEHHLVITEAEVGSPVTYYAGSCWDKSAGFSGVSDWEAYLAEYAQRVRSPLKVTLSQQ